MIRLKHSALKWLIRTRAALDYRRSQAASNRDPGGRDVVFDADAAAAHGLAAWTSVLTMSGLAFLEGVSRRQVGEVFGEDDGSVGEPGCEPGGGAKGKHRGVAVGEDREGIVDP